MTRTRVRLEQAEDLLTLVNLREGRPTSHTGPDGTRQPGCLFVLRRPRPDLSIELWVMLAPRGARRLHVFHGPRELLAYCQGRLAGHGALPNPTG